MYVYIRACKRAGRPLIPPNTSIHRLDLLASSVVVPHGRYIIYAVRIIIILYLNDTITG